MSTVINPSLTPESARSPSGAGQAFRNALLMGSRLFALLAIFIGFRLVVPGFASASNIENIFRQSSVYAMAGLGMTMVIITGGIDLASGSTIALSMVVTAMVLNSGRGEVLTSHPLAWAGLSVLAGTAAATIVGIVQGLLITGLRLVPFIVTLGGLQVVRGMTKGIADNQEISPPTTNFLFRYVMSPVQGRNFNWTLFPPGVWATLAAAVFAAALLRYTKLGRRIFAVGSNESTARLCGVPVSGTKILVYAIAGAFAGLAGVLEFSKLNMGQPTGALSYELYVIAACVIGGTSLRGGIGTISGTVIGALIIGTLNIGAGQAPWFNAPSWPKWVQEVVIGIIIVVAVALDQLRDRVKM